MLDGYVPDGDELGQLLNVYAPPFRLNAVGDVWAKRPVKVIERRSVEVIRILV
jgi:hypothetical protein